jgi:hypothetical protein
LRSLLGDLRVVRLAWNADANWPMVLEEKTRKVE